MKYLLSFNESYKADKVLAIKLLRKKYSDKLDDCLLYLSDNYDPSITVSEGWSVDDFYIRAFKINVDDNRDELIKCVEMAIDKLSFNKYEYLDDYRIQLISRPNTNVNGLTIIHLDHLIPNIKSINNKISNEVDFIIKITFTNIK